MDLLKILAEIGRMHLELVLLREQLAQAEAKIPKLPAPVAEPEKA